MSVHAFKIGDIVTLTFGSTSFIVNGCVNDDGHLTSKATEFISLISTDDTSETIIVHFSLLKNPDSLDTTAIGRLMK